MKQNLAMALLERPFAEPGRLVDVIIRGKPVPARVIDLPLQPQENNLINNGKNTKGENTMETRHDRLYTKDHEWVLLEGSRQKSASRTTPRIRWGRRLCRAARRRRQPPAGDVLGAVESVKAASEVYTPLSGTVIAVNEALEDAPESLNEQPYEQWLAELELSDPAELGQLLDEAAYQDFCAGEEH